MVRIMDKLKYIIPIGFLLFGACTSPEEMAVSESEDSGVHFRAIVAKGRMRFMSPNIFMRAMKSASTVR